MANLYPTSPVILDGGFGTTLEDLFNIDISHSPLWSAKAIIENPETIIATHLAFLRAGARIISTSTYQCSLSTFRQAGYSDTDSISVMLEAVRLAEQARSVYATETSSRVNIKIALSLGPFGATLAPTQEFDGYYPPPFGPMGYSKRSDRCNTFGEDKIGEAASIEALSQFHLERLRIFATDPEVWKVIDFVAFETVPLVREVRAIKNAMLKFQNEFMTKKLWWVSFVMPEGKCPEIRFTGGPHMSIFDLVYAAFDRRPVSLEGDGTEGVSAPIPNGIGINCTSIKHISSLVNEMTQTVQELVPMGNPKPWIVLYPDGGDTYDPVSRSWRAQEKSDRDLWASQLGSVVEKLEACDGGYKWAGVVVGGCCRTLPEQIHLLDKVINCSEV